jgi:hypothetical protein
LPVGMSAAAEYAESLWIARSMSPEISRNPVPVIGAETNFANPVAIEQHRKTMSDHHAHANSSEQVLGVTRDPALRPIGILMVVVGSLWALFAGMSLEAGSYGQPLAALALIGLGVLLAGAGKSGEQI